MNRWVPLLVASFTTWIGQPYLAARHPHWLESLEERPAPAPDDGPASQPVPSSSVS